MDWRKKLNKLLKLPNWIIILVIVVLLSLSINHMLAYLTDGDTNTNTIHIGGTNITINEEFDPEPIVPGAIINKKVKIHNDGPNTCYIRTRVLFSDSDVEQYAEVDWNRTDWVYNPSDGFNYYKYPVEVGKSTSYLMTEIVFNTDMPQNMIKDVNVLVYTEAYQAEASDSYLDAWEKYQENMN